MLLTKKINNILTVNKRPECFLLLLTFFTMYLKEETLLAQIKITTRDHPLNKSNIQRAKNS